MASFAKPKLIYLKGAFNMTRMYLSPTATFFAKAGLFFVECLIGLYNLITYPIRKITIKAYLALLLFAAGSYFVGNYFGYNLDLVATIAALVVFTIAIYVSKMLHKYFKNKVSPKVAFLLSSPLGIPLNKFYKVA